MLFTATNPVPSLIGSDYRDRLVVDHIRERNHRWCFAYTAYICRFAVEGTKRAILGR